MKPVMLLLGACIIILLAPAVLPAVNDFRSEDFNASHSLVVTGVGETTANVTFTQDLFGSRTSEVTSITSNVSADVPIATTYTASLDRLLVSGLVASTTRTLTIVYKIGTLDDYVGADLGARTWPMFLVVGVIGVIAAAVYVGTRRE